MRKRASTRHLFLAFVASSFAVFAVFSFFRPAALHSNELSRVE